MAVNYQKKLDNLKTQFSLASDEFVQSYPQAQQFPNINSYQVPFRNANQAITDANADLFSLEGEVRSAVTELARNLKVVDDKIDQLRDNNDKLSQKASDIKGADKGAEGRSENARQTSYLTLYGSLTLAGVAYFTYKMVRHSS